MKRHVLLQLNTAHYRGGFLIEAMVSCLIVAVGLVSTMALQGRVASYMAQENWRAEALQMAEAYISEIWARKEDSNTIIANYQSGDPEHERYALFKKQVEKKFPNAGADLTPNPIVKIEKSAADDEAAVVKIQIKWRHPGDLNATPHQMTLITTVLPRS